MGLTKILTVAMVNFKALISSVRALVQTSTDYAVDTQFFGSFSNTNLIVWLNDFFSQKFLNIIVVFEYCFATVISLSKSIAKFCKFIFLKRGTVLTSSRPWKKRVLWARAKPPFLR